MLRSTLHPPVRSELEKVSWRCVLIERKKACCFNLEQNTKRGRPALKGAGAADANRHLVCCSSGKSAEEPWNVEIMQITYDSIIWRCVCV